jgi:Na+-translocating ferredoxin:NAD+ oxidoreductase RnfD subunit
MNVELLEKSRLYRVMIRYFRTPKGLLLLVLTTLAMMESVAVGFSRTLPVTASAVVAAVVIEDILMTVVRRERSFPSGALLTGLIVAMVLSPETSPIVAASVSGIAIASKYVFHTKWSNVFNPAALALVVGYFAFGTGQSWWGALPDLPVVGIGLLIAAGSFVADRVNKIPMALVFLGAFFGLATLTVYASDPSRAQELFRVPDLNAALFFALFMLDDPPTSPVRYADQVMFALIAAVVGYAVFATLGGVYYLPAGVLAANVWETLRRIEERSPDKSRATRQPAIQRVNSRSA